MTLPFWVNVMSRYFPNLLLLSLMPVFALPKASIRGLTCKIFSSRFFLGALPMLTSCLSWIINQVIISQGYTQEESKWCKCDGLIKVVQEIQRKREQHEWKKQTESLKHESITRTLLTRRLALSVLPEPLSPEITTHWLWWMWFISR